MLIFHFLVKDQLGFKIKGSRIDNVKDYFNHIYHPTINHKALSTVKLPYPHASQAFGAYENLTWYHSTGIVMANHNLELLLKDCVNYYGWRLFLMICKSNGKVLWSFAVKTSLLSTLAIVLSSISKLTNISSGIIWRKD